MPAPHRRIPDFPGSSRNSRRTGIGAAAALLALCALAGCSTGGSGGSSTAEPTLAAIPTVTNAAQLTLPLDAYLLSDQQNQSISIAHDILVRSCMRRFGLAWPGGSSVASTQTDQYRNARRYFLFDAASAASYGYHQSPGGTQGGKLSNGVLTKDQQAVYIGSRTGAFAGQTVPAGGCAGEANRRLQQGQPAAASGKADPQELSLQSYALAGKDSRVLAATKAWSQCMAARGYSYLSPEAANNDPQWRNPVSAKEIATAGADVARKAKTDYVGTFFAVESAYQSRMIDADAQALAAVRDQIGVAVRNAAQVVSGQ